MNTVLSFAECAEVSQYQALKRDSSQEGLRTRQIPGQINAARRLEIVQRALCCEVPWQEVEDYLDCLDACSRD